MIPMDDDGSENNDEVERMEAEALALTTRWEDSDLEGRLRKLGVYVDHVHVVPMPTPMGIKMGLAVVGKVNRVAFSTRVLDPEAAQIDQQFRTMAVEAADDDFTNTQIQIQRNIAAGRDPLDDGDGDDEA